MQRGGWAMMMAVMAASATAQTPPAPRPGTAQARYDAAQAAYDKGDWQAAADGFAPLLPRDPAAPLGPSAAVIAVRLADSLDRLGRFDEAEAMARRAIAAIDPGRLADLAQGWIAIAEAERHAQRFSAALESYARALDYAVRAKDDFGRTNAAIGMGFTAMTVDPARAAPVVAAVIDDAALAAKLDPATRSRLEEVSALLALNAGRLADARAAIDRAIRASGGAQSTRVSLQQVDVRGDAAIIASRMNDPESARRYLAYTGAGHLDSIDRVGKHVGELPVCGTEGDLRPDDVAIVQFGLASDGTVAGALPIYASRTGEVGAAFSRALSGWRWDPAQIKGVRPFWLSNVRFEMRCDTRPDPAALSRPFAEATARWLASRGVTYDPDDHVFVAANDPRLSAPAFAAFPAMLSRLGDPGDAKTYLPRLYALLDRGDAPPEARALVLSYAARTADRNATSPRSAGARLADAYARSVPDFAARYPGSVATAWLQLEWAIALETAGNFSAAEPLLHAVLDRPTDGPDADDPLRKVAVLHLAIVRGRRGDAPGAAAAIARSGISAEQCSLVDTRPVPTNLAMGSSDFPNEALRWGFEGYVQVAYDIGGDGHVSGVRTVLAYPPFVFDAGTETAARRFRYAAPTIAGKPVGCQGETQTVNYRLPDR